MRESGRNCQRTKHRPTNRVRGHRYLDMRTILWISWMSPLNCMVVSYLDINYNRLLSNPNLLIVHNHLTECRGRVLNTPASNHGFKSRRETGNHDRSVVVFLSISR